MATAPMAAAEGAAAKQAAACWQQRTDQDALQPQGVRYAWLQYLITVGTTAQIRRAEGQQQQQLFELLVLAAVERKRRSCNIC